MNVLETLHSARDLLADDDNWTKGSYARTSTSSAVSVDPSHPRAKCWCLAGALYRAADLPVGGNLLPEELTDAVGQPEHEILNFNDSPNTSHADVLALLDKANSLRMVDTLIDHRNSFSALAAHEDRARLRLAKRLIRLNRETCFPRATSRQATQHLANFGGAFQIQNIATRDALKRPKAAKRLSRPH